eukprot:TRINITY_DN6738_c0_g1_i6.p1 TRINITY_DN6738_c0_g1~~TRINITY_DN6738_c0_g1_i6.p1  ORF type:complete len:131 (+),score=8.47 TRINITY_DN6738_c0_g1_i6:92-484(+)
MCIRDSTNDVYKFKAFLALVFGNSVTALRYLKCCSVNSNQQLEYYLLTSKALFDTNLLAFEWSLFYTLMLAERKEDKKILQEARIQSLKTLSILQEWKFFDKYAQSMKSELNHIAQSSLILLQSNETSME